VKPTPSSRRITGVPQNQAVGSRASIGTCTEDDSELSVELGNPAIDQLFYSVASSPCSMNTWRDYVLLATKGVETTCSPISPRIQGNININSECSGGGLRLSLRIAPCGDRTWKSFETTRTATIALQTRRNSLKPRPYIGSLSLIIL